MGAPLIVDDGVGWMRCRWWWWSTRRGPLFIEDRIERRLHVAPEDARVRREPGVSERGIRGGDKILTTYR